MKIAGSASSAFNSASSSFQFPITWFIALSIALAGLLACSESSTSPSTDSTTGRIEAGLVGTWVENPAGVFSPDTLIFAENKIQTPFFSAVGTMFSAKSGLVKGGPSMDIVGEYLRFGDTLYFDALLGEGPNGVDVAKSPRFLRLKP